MVDGIEVKKTVFRGRRIVDEELWEVHVPAFIIPCLDEEHANEQMGKLHDILKGMGALEL